MIDQKMAMTPSRPQNSSSQRVARAINTHGVLCVVFSAILYLLAVTGTLAIWSDELRRLEQPFVPEMAVIAPDAAARGARELLQSEPTSAHLYIHYPSPEMPRALVRTDNKAAYLNPNGTLNQPRETPWTQFLLDLHYYLHLPQTLGLIIVGLAGAMLLGLSVTGLLAHPRIIRDAFKLRRGSDRSATADLHNRLAVWTAPFHIAIALTGAAIGLATVLAAVIAFDQFGNDAAKVFEPVFGKEHATDPRPAPLPNLVAPYASLKKAQPAVVPTTMIVHDPGTRAQSILMLAKHPDRLIFGEYYYADAAGTAPKAMGLANGKTGQQVTASVYSVHFGDWGGVPIKLAYTVLGLVLCVIISAGMKLYFQRRRQQGSHACFGEAVWSGIVWGVPAGLLATALSSFASLSASALIAVFWTIIAVGSIAMPLLQLRGAAPSQRLT